MDIYLGRLITVSDNMLTQLASNSLTRLTDEPFTRGSLLRFLQDRVVLEEVAGSSTIDVFYGDKGLCGKVVSMWVETVGNYLLLHGSIDVCGPAGDSFSKDRRMQSGFIHPVVKYRQRMVGETLVRDFVSLSKFTCIPPENRLNGV